ncbi:hypothetical protein BJY00DRAFT_283521 [Aspergillus carlsbadensis]|nr:hypothetical protein BJY00DRAFT_283521 [Aspergillus carlsbadensis]
MLPGDGYRKVAKQKACLARLDHLVDAFLPMISAPEHKGTYWGCQPSRGMHLNNVVMGSSKANSSLPGATANTRISFPYYQSVYREDCRRTRHAHSARKSLVAHHRLHRYQRKSQLMVLEIIKLCAFQSDRHSSPLRPKPFILPEDLIVSSRASTAGCSIISASSPKRP